METKEAGVTMKQADFIRQLATRKDGREVPAFDGLTMGAAKTLISGWLAEDGQGSGTKPIKEENVNVEFEAVVLEQLAKILEAVRK